MDLKSLEKTIYTRRSYRRYKKGGIGEEKRELIMAAVASLRPLFPEIKYAVKLFDRSEVRTIMPWMPEDAVAVWSEEGEGALLNVGFILEQLDLYIQSIGLGSCWVGLARPKSGEGCPEGMSFMMLLAVGEPIDQPRSGVFDFKRKSLEDISDTASPMLEPARLAPSSVNSQPWYFSAIDGGFDVYMQRLVRTKGLKRMNKIDVGIALAHIYVSRPDSFSAFVREDGWGREDMDYLISILV
ncbi:MAG: hypothetical protein IKC32_04595 [Clostridia bacterium]|nr:hypothetical protein [Clostridia bacterium]